MNSSSAVQNKMKISKYAKLTSATVDVTPQGVCMGSHLSRTMYVYPWIHMSAMNICFTFV